MNEKVTLKNDSPVIQNVEGHGDVAAGGTLQVSKRVASHLLRGKEWMEVKPAKAAQKAKAAPAQEDNNGS